MMKRLFYFAPFDLPVGGALSLAAHMGRLITEGKTASAPCICPRVTLPAKKSLAESCSLGQQVMHGFSPRFSGEL
jgi:hypothetical protein